MTYGMFITETQNEIHVILELYSQFNGTFYEHVNGLAMGAPTSVVL
jgi:hypothetical protein